MYIDKPIIIHTVATNFLSIQIKNFFALQHTWPNFALASSCPEKRTLQWAAHALVRPWWIDSPLMPPRTDQMSDSRIRTTHTEDAQQSSVSGGFQQCEQNTCTGTAVQHLSCLLWTALSMSLCRAPFTVVPLSWSCASTGPRKSQKRDDSV
jgi:hypothetical protein